jgi:hypothetical protein
MALRLNNGVSDEWAHWDGAGTNIKTDGNTDWGMGGWFYWETDAGINEYAAAIGPVVSGAGTTHALRVSSATNSWQIDAAGTTTLLGATLGQWIYVAWGATTSGSGRAWYGTGTTLTEVAAQPNSGTAMDCIIFGHTPASGNSSFRGRIAYPRVFSGAMPSQADWEAEMISTTPVGGVGGALLSSLFAAYLFDSSGSASAYLNDVSGNGRHLTGVNTGFLVNCVADPTLGGSTQSNAPRAAALYYNR